MEYTGVKVLDDIIDNYIYEMNISINHKKCMNELLNVMNNRNVYYKKSSLISYLFYIDYLDIINFDKRIKSCIFIENNKYGRLFYSF
jgi:hypothetical protein